MHKEEFNSDRAPKPVGSYPHARRAGEFLFLSGVGPRIAGGADIPGVTLNENSEIICYNIEEQCHAVFQNIKYILNNKFYIGEMSFGKMKNSHNYGNLISKRMFNLIQK